MRRHHDVTNTRRALLGILLTLGLSGTLRAQETESSDVEWPRDIMVPNATITIYQPQLETFEGDTLTGRAAVSVLQAGATDAVFGAVWVSARVSTDRDERLVTVLDIDVTKIVFPNAPDEKVKLLAQIIEEHVPAWKLEISLDRLLTGLDLVEKKNEAAESLRHDPPEILVSTRPAILLVLDGEPELRQVDGTDLLQVVNTPYFVVLHPESQGYFFFTGSIWMKATDLNGDWKEVMSAPAAVADYAKKEGVLPDEKIKPTTDRAPEILVRTQPAELIVIDGKPTYKTLEGTQLLYISNTTSDVFLELASQKTFLLLSGRWYEAANLEGPWTLVPSGELPEEFRKIPADSEKGDVLASVAGTDEAREAVLETQIPQTTQVERTATIRVNYDGVPKWTRIEGTDMDYATNTERDVLRVEGRFYCCEEAIWYESSNPYGPYIVCVSVPPVVYTIPPQYPVYRVRYVHVYRATPTVVYVGYLPGYTGCYVWGGTVVWGTGYWYRGWYGRSIRVVYTRPRTWGFAVAYSPWRGVWGFRVGYGFRGGAVAVGGGWWGARGYHRYQMYDRRMDQIDRRLDQRDRRLDQIDRRLDRGENIYNQRRGRGAGRYSNTVRYDNRAASTAASRAARPATRESPPAAGATRRAAPTRSRQNNVYSDRQGNVYRRTQNGWEQRTRSGWTRTQPSTTRRSATERATRPPTRRSTPPTTSRPAPSTSRHSSLDRAYQSRQRGSTRTRTYRSRAPVRSIGGRR